MPYLTVKEAMMVSANLKLGKDMKMSAKKIVVEEILEALGLSETSNTKTVNLSGGQRKRLSIALELVNNPPVMFFDEPTSGLDSSSCFQLISLLKSLARGGRTVVCTIHQPSARLFEMFDHLYMLAEGQCIYQGRVEGLVPYLATLGYECPSYHNPADYGKLRDYLKAEECLMRMLIFAVMEVASGEYGEAVHNLVLAVSGAGKKQYQHNTNTQAQPESDPSNVQGIANISKNISNDISKLSSPSKTQTIGQPTQTVANKQSSSQPDDGLTLLKYSKGDSSVIQMTNNDDTSAIKAVPSTTCTTSLLDSNESVITLPNKGAFPTSGFRQFWILLKRAFKTIIRDKQLTQMRLASHLIVGAIIGMIYYDIGNEASKVMSNAGCIFFTTLFTMFTAMMPTILTCE